MLTLVGIVTIMLNLLVSQIISTKRVNITRVQMRDQGKHDYFLKCRPHSGDPGPVEHVVRAVLLHRGKCARIIKACC